MAARGDDRPEDSVNHGDRARQASWMLTPCPVCSAVPGQRCRIAPGAFQAIFHAERASMPKKPVVSVNVEDVAERRSA